MELFLVYTQVYFLFAGLPHTQGTQGIQGNSRNFQVEENLRETQGDSGNLREFWFIFETQGSFKISKISEELFARVRIRFN